MLTAESVVSSILIEVLLSLSSPSRPSISTDSVDPLLLVLPPIDSSVVITTDGSDVADPGESFSDGSDAAELTVVRSAESVIANVVLSTSEPLDEMSVIAIDEASDDSPSVVVVTLDFSVVVISD